MMIDITKFTTYEWACFHDAILTATWNTTKRKCTQEELEKVFNELPEHLQYTAAEHGMNDTVFKDGVIEWYERDNNHETTYEEK